MEGGWGEALFAGELWSGCEGGEGLFGCLFVFFGIVPLTEMRDKKERKGEMEREEEGSAFCWGACWLGAVLIVG